MNIEIGKNMKRNKGTKGENDITTIKINLDIFTDENGNIKERDKKPLMTLLKELEEISNNL
jgi:hypothetical protein